MQLWGDCHTHSTFSDGLFSIEEQTPFFEAFGCGFRMQTDHLVVAVPEGRPAGKWLHAVQWSAYCAACQKATSATHVCIPGAEVVWELGPAAENQGWAHTKLYPAQGVAFPNESFFGQLTYVEMLVKAKAAGYRPVIAHIDQGASLERLTGSEVCGLEVRGDIEETRPLVGRPSLKHWDRMLTAGHGVSLSSGSDAHQPDLWAGSGLRTVVLDTARDAEAIADAVVAGRSYLSGTWHPDCYAAAGWPERDNTVAGGRTHFQPWWEFAKCPALQGRPPRDVVISIFETALKAGRCRRDDYPVLHRCTINGASPGQETAAAAKAEVDVAWRTHVPVRVARLLADGQVVFQVSATRATCGAWEGELHTTLDLRGRRYVRFELEAVDPADSTKRESLLANPIYLAG